MSIERDIIRLAKTVAEIGNLANSNPCSEPGCSNMVSKPGYKYCYEHWRQHQNKPQNITVNYNFVSAHHTVETLEKCSEPGCSNIVSKAGYKYCYEHWRQHQNKPQTQNLIATPDLISAGKIAAFFQLPNHKINAILADIGLLKKSQNGWEPTSLGSNFGAIAKIHPQDSTPYVLWPASILENQAFITTIQNLLGSAESVKSDRQNASDFRQKFKEGANIRAQDGHWVRSKAEKIIDDWLYYSGIVHAYEPQVRQATEVLYSDFYIPEGKVYIEYWGYQQDQEYHDRQKVKQGIYQKYNLNLIELSDVDIQNIDDLLPRQLRQFGVKIE